MRVRNEIFKSGLDCHLSTNLFAIASSWSLSRARGVGSSGGELGVVGGAEKDEGGWRLGSVLPLSGPGGVTGLAEAVTST